MEPKNEPKKSVNFPAMICRVKTMADNGLRVELDLPDMDTLNPALGGVLLALVRKPISVKLEDL